MRKFSKETRDKIRLKATGRILSEDTKNKISQSLKSKGIKPPVSVKSQFKSGSAHPLWKGGITKDPKYVSWSKNQWHHRRRSALGSHTYGEWELLKEQYNYTCPCCHKSEPEIKLSQDHIIPLTKGGSNNIQNIQPLCRGCNCKKNTKSTYYKNNK